jgi:hypothetical protein
MSSQPSPTTAASSASTWQPPPNPAHRCFICLVDSGEPGDGGDWVHPSPCALEAHHACLLKWMDDAVGTSGNVKKTLECPQCKAPIRAVTPRDRAIEASRNLECGANRLAPLFVPLSLSATFIAGQAWYGQMAEGLFFEGRFPDVVEISFGRLGAASFRQAMIMPTLLSYSIFPNFTGSLMWPCCAFVSCTAPAHRALVDRLANEVT